MAVYRPERWVVLEFTHPKHGVMQKVFGGWYGGYLGGDSWKLNSGITKTSYCKDTYEFEGYSGSTYECHTHNYGMTSYMEQILKSWQAEATPGVNIQQIAFENIAIS